MVSYVKGNLNATTNHFTLVLFVFLLYFSLAALAASISGPLVDRWIFKLQETSEDWVKCFIRS